MGIHNLTRHILPLADAVQLGDSQGQDVGKQDIKPVRTVIIDGPSLVYDVYVRLLSWADGSSCYLNMLPTYEQVSFGVIFFLLQLRLANVKVLKIFFDGALPSCKREERLRRLEKSRKKLDTFCYFTRQGFEVHDHGRQLMTDPLRLLQTRPIGRRALNLPDLPFLVPSVIEDLNMGWTWNSFRYRHDLDAFGTADSDYEENPWASVCELVPGEADAFCAEFARKSQTAILTNDSDLLIHDLGPQGSVIFLNSIEADPDYRNGRHKSSRIRGLEISPMNAAMRLGVPNIQSFAFELSRLTRRNNLREIVASAKQHHTIGEDNNAYRLFLKQYISGSFFEPFPWSSNLQGLDVRLSEVIVQFLVPNAFNSGSPHLYLPNLIEDHSRRCAWQEGRKLRSLAFSLLGHSDIFPTKHRGYVECVRRGHRYCFDEIPFLNKDQITSGVREFLSALTTLRMAFEPSTIERAFYWRLCAYFQISSTAVHVYPRERHHYERLYSDFLGLEIRKSRIDWLFIHRVAQLQSVLYSFRILKQILMLAGYEQWMTQDEWALLKTLPSLQVLMRSYGEIRRECLEDEDIIANTAIKNFERDFDK